MTASSPLRRGLGPRFRVEHELGRGATGTVFAAFDRARGAPVAIKRLDRLTPPGLLRFKREFRRLANLRHAGLVSLHELVVDEDEALLVMELVAGSPLDRSVPLPLARVRDGFRQLAEALAFLHAHAILHRDLKPANVMIEPGGRVVLLDFGLITDRSPHASEEVLGTPAYTSPEQALGEPTTEASDWYGLGALLFEVLAGRPPFEGRALEVLLAKTERPAPALRSAAPDAPDDLAALVDALLRRDPRERPRESEVLEALGAQASPPRRPSWVGRGPVLARILSAITQPGPRLVVVEASSGVGKTRLLEAAADALEQDHLVLTGRCFAQESVRYAALDGAIDRLASVLASDASLRAGLEANLEEASLLFPVLSATSGARSSDERRGDPLERRRRAMAALSALLDEVSARRPLVVVLDDLQWADGASVPLLRALLEGARAPSCGWIVAFRAEASGGVPATLRALVGRPGVEHVALGALDRDASRELLVAAGLTAERAEALSEAGGGHPLLLSELGRAALAHRTLAGLDELLLAHVAELSDGARDALELIAVAGRPLAAAELAAACGSAVGPLLDELLHTRLVGRVDADGGRGFHPFHDRLAEAIRASLPPARRTAAAARLSSALDASPFAAPEEIAGHLIASGSPQNAIAYLERAVQGAMRALAWERAIELLEQLLALEVRTAARSHAFELLAISLSGAGRNLEAAEAYQRALPGAADPVRAEELRFAVADRTLRGGDLDRGLRAMDEALRAVGARMQRSLAEAVASLLYHRAQLVLRGPHFVARAASEIDPAALRRVDRLWSAGMGLTSIDSVRGTDFMARAMLAALEVGEPMRVARGLATEAAAVANRGVAGRSEALAHLRRAREIGQDIADPTLQALLFSVETLVELHGGELESALRIAREAEQRLSSAFAMAREVSIARFVELQMLALLGHFDELRARSDVLVPEVDALGERYGMAMLRNGLCSRRWLADDDPARAHAENLRALEVWPATPFRVPHFASFFGRVDAWLYEARIDEAIEEVERARRPLDRSFLRRVEFIDVITIDVRARVALARGDARSLRSVEQAIAQLAATGSRLGRSFAAMLEAGVRRLAGEGAAAAFDRAELECRNAGLVPHALVAAWHAARARGQPSGEVERALASLGLARPDRYARMLCPAR